jgi:hypothetical protein
LPAQQRPARLTELDLSQMTQHSADNLLDEITRVSHRTALAPIIGVAAVVVVLGLAANHLPVNAIAVAGSMGVLAFVLAALADQRRGHIALTYGLEDEHAPSFQTLVDAFHGLARSGRVREVESAGGTQDWKRNAGATSLAQFRTLYPGFGTPRGVTTNIEVPCLRLRAGRVHFFPDRILAFGGHDVGSVPYSEVSVDCRQVRCIEQEGVPQDAQVVAHSWQFVNKDGSPDRRFSHNRELPVVLYAHVTLTSPRGLNVTLQVSDMGSAQMLTAAMQQMGAAHAEVADVSPHSPAEVPQAGTRAPHGDMAGGGGSEAGLSEEAARLLKDRPSAWEYLLFAEALDCEIAQTRSQPWVPQQSHGQAQSEAEAWSSLSECLDEATRIILSLSRLFEQDLQTALGPPGESGDAEKIIRVAHAIGDVYARMQGFRASVEAMPVPSRLARLAGEIARSLNGTRTELEGYPAKIRQAIQSTLAAPPGSPAQELNIALRIRLENEASLQAALRAAQR